MHKGVTKFVNRGRGTFLHKGVTKFVNRNDGVLLHKGVTKFVNRNDGVLLHKGVTKFVNRNDGVLLHKGVTKFVNKLKKKIFLFFHKKKLIPYTAKMSVIVYDGEVYEIVKKRKLETIEESVEEDNIDGGGDNIQDKIIESESESFLKLLEKTFADETEIFNSENDSVDGFMDELLTKVSLKIKDKIENSNNNSSIGIRLIKLILAFLKTIQLTKKENDENKSSCAAKTSEH